MRVVHVGNDAMGSGGIASVIQQHLRRPWSVAVYCVTSYRQDAVGMARHLPWFKAAKYLLGLRPEADRVIHVHLSQRGSIVREGSLLWLARLRGHSSTVATLHGSGAIGMGHIERLVLRAALHTTAATHVLSDVHREQLSLHNAVVIFNDVTMPPAVAPMSLRSKTVVFVGEIGYRKGVDLLAMAWSAVNTPGWSLHCYGKIGSARADREALELIRGTGASITEVPREKLIAILSNSAIVVLPSRAEALPMAICEAMATGCAIVASDVGGTRELLTSSPHVVSSGDVAGLTQQLRTLIESPEARTTDATRNRARAQQVLDTYKVTEQWLDLYANVLRRVPGQSHWHEP